MGTNFYIHIPIKNREKLKEEVCEAIDNNRIDDVIDKLQSIHEETFIHLGKRSGGWKFLFNAHNEKYYKCNKKSIDNFITSNNAAIQDEYERSYTLDEFWNDVEDLKDGIDLEEYYKENPTERYYPRHYNGPLSKYHPNQYDEFYNDGLRFTVCDEFS